VRVTPIQVVFETDRLLIRIATEGDLSLFHTLWTNPQVMVHVGFPQGIPLSLDEMKAKPFKVRESEFGHPLVVELKATGEGIGECKLSQPDEAGISEPDIKLLPAFWGQKYGSEVWEGLLAYQFEHTDCLAVQTTPNVANKGAIRMYEAAGAVREGESVYHFPESMQAYTTPVHYYIYRLYRQVWEEKRGKN
jgi:RimJ/RimL family protein N-acetyltransferase